MERCLACEADGMVGRSFGCAFPRGEAYVVNRALTEMGYVSRWPLVHHGLASEATLHSSDRVAP
jgi:hypothetical protein